MIALELNSYGVIAHFNGVNGYGRTIAEAISDLMYKLGKWHKGN